MDDYYDVSFLRTQEFKFCIIKMLSAIILFSTLSICVHDSIITTEMRSVVVTDAMDIVTLPINLTTKVSAEYGNIVQNKHDNSTQYGTNKSALLMAYSQDDMENMKTVASVKSVESMELEKDSHVKKRKLAKYKASEIKAVKNTKYNLNTGISDKYIMKNDKVFIYVMK